MHADRQLIIIDRSAEFPTRLNDFPGIGRILHDAHFLYFLGVKFVKVLDNIREADGLTHTKVKSLKNF